MDCTIVSAEKHFLEMQATLGCETTSYSKSAQQVFPRYQFNVIHLGVQAPCLSILLLLPFSLTPQQMKHRPHRSDGFNFANFFYFISVAPEEGTV